MERVILALKQLHFTIPEIRQITVDDALTFIDLSIPEKDEDKKPKRASQADIDRFMR